jgi:DNA-binding NtrC family response regulator
MAQLLCGPPEVDLRSLAKIFSQHGVDTALLPLSGGPPTAPQSAVETCFLISPEQGAVSVGQRIVEVRRWLQNGTPLVACIPIPTQRDRETFEECGASAVISPGGWGLGQVAERILAELILAGRVQPSSCGSLLGATPGMREVYLRLEKVAPLGEPVLVLGETGTGKELVASEIHRRSGRRGELLAVNCAALTPELLESELFGHERGAFTGAMTSRQGLVVEAGKGTLFLDEIGDLALSSQAKLLRVLEERKVRPVGANRWQPVESRIVLATHRDLEEACEEGRFRADLFHRISGLTLRLPPLRERRPDLLLLAQHFLNEYNRTYPGRRFAPSGTFDSLFRYSWPGNVRELRQAVWQAATYAEGEEGPISVLSLSEWSSRRDSTERKPQLTFDPSQDTWQDVLDRTRASYFRAVLLESGGNRDLAAKRAGLSRSRFFEILKEIREQAGEG